MRNHNICIFMPTASYLIWGAENVAIEQAIFFSKYWYQVTFIALKYWELTEKFKLLLQYQINIVFFSNSILPSHIIRNVKLTHDNFHTLYESLGKELYHFLKIHDFDIIINHYAPAWNFIPDKLLSCIILHWTPETIKKIDILWVLNSTYKIAVSQSVQKWRLNLIPYNISIDVNYNGIDTLYFIPQNLKKTIDIFFIWRHIEIKWIQYLIQAISYLKNTYKSIVKTVIWWTWPYTLHLKRLVKEYQLTNDISFVWSISEKDKLHYYNSSKIVVFPSYKKEWVLTTMLEAWSCASCIITCNCCWMKDFVIDDYNAIFCNPQNYMDLGEKIKYALANQMLRDKLGKNARETILNKWTWDYSIQNFIRLLKL